MTAQSQLVNKLFFLSDGFGIEPKVYDAGSGKKVFANVAVFRSGTFRDSTGVQNTWEDLHIKQMLDNYNHLASKNILTSVPARDGHPGWLINNIPGKGAVVGWHTGLTTKTMKSPVDGQEYSYLLADYEITEPYALEKIANGTWRNRSAEIGDYTTNNESEFWPVYMGFAFVDLPAVEGLNFSSSHNGKFFAFFDGTSREIQVSGQSGAGPALPVLPPVAPPAPVAPSVPAPPVQPAPPSQHAAPATPPAAPFVFSIGGRNETDPNVVQTYVRQLEQFMTDTVQAGRKAFVAHLVSTGRILAPQQEAQEAFALSLTNDQYEAWKKGWEAAPATSVLGLHGAGTAYVAQGQPAQPGQQGQHSAAEQELLDAEEIVKMHERGGVMTPEQIKNTTAYKKLLAAGRRQA